MDFVQTMKDWRRMCNAYTTDDESCCDGCPVADFREHGCGAIFEMEDSTDWQRYADAIRAWAAEHPGPVYPAWRTWLTEKYDFDLREIMYAPIPADIAQKLGIAPKEGT